MNEYIYSIYIYIYIYTPWSRVLVQKLTGFQLVKKLPAFMEHEVVGLHIELNFTLFIDVLPSK
jgi:hypothetical protein